jgi:hypothetical protein
MSDHSIQNELRKSFKPFELALAMTCFGAATAMLAIADSPLAYGIAAFDLFVSGLMVWQGRLWK